MSDNKFSNPAENERVHGYEIKRAIVFENSRGFALAENPNAVTPFVTWQFTEDENGQRDYYWGHYAGSKDAATRDYEMRVDSYHKDYQIFPANGYLYYSTQRPIDIGTFPRTENGPIIIANFDMRENVVKEAFRAWGYLVYDAPLTEKQISDYELRAAHDNPDVVKLMMEQAQVVGHWEEMKGLPDNERFTWHRPSIQAFEMRTPRVSPEQMAKRFNHAQQELGRAALGNADRKPIAEQLKDGAKQAAKDNAARPAPAKDTDKDR